MSFGGASRFGEHPLTKNAKFSIPCGAKDRRVDSKVNVDRRKTDKARYMDNVEIAARSALLSDSQRRIADTRKTDQKYGIGKVWQTGVGGPRMSADGSYMESGANTKAIRSTTPGGPLALNPLSDADCEFDEELARAFANGLKMNTTSVGGSAPSSPVSDPGAASRADDLAKRTVIILDWDDTLLTTTRLMSRFSVVGVGATKPLPAGLKRDLHALENDVIHLLECCVGRGRTAIVTNAAEGWVQMSGRRFVPGVVQAIEKHNISVVSAQTAFAKTCPSGDQGC